MSVTIRRERPGDAAAIRAVVEAAFPTAAEADLVDALRDCGDIVCSLVAEDGGSLIGQVIVSRMAASGDGNDIAAAGLAPLAVTPDRQREGLGGRLVRSAIDDVRAQGISLLFLVGDPDFYGGFGFSTKAARPFASPYAGRYFQMLALDQSFVLPKSGRADYTAPFAAFGGE